MGAVARRIQSLGKVNEAIKDLRYRDVQKPGMSAEVGMFEKKAPAKKSLRAAKQKTPTKQAVA